MIISKMPITIQYFNDDINQYDSFKKIKIIKLHIDDEKNKRHNQFVNIFDTYHIDILTKYNI